MEEVSLVSPLRLYLPRKTKKDKMIALSTNIYRNLHYQVNKDIKNMYSDMMVEKVRDAFKECEVETPIQIEYVLYKGRNNRLDLTNFTLVIDKFFQDVLVEAGIIEDDTCEIIPRVISTYGGFDKGNERCEIYIRPFKSLK